MKEQVGLIGVGLMGHGIARNLLRHGYQLTVTEHPGNQPLDELVAAGVRTCRLAADVARAADVIILCVTGSPEVEAVLSGPDGVLDGLRQNAIVIDCSTAVPASTQRMAGLVERAQGRFIDAPMTRTARHAREGKLNLLVGGDLEAIQNATPILSCFAENITHVGPVGSGHRMKLLHNYVSLGFIALLAEASACARRSGVAPDVFIDVLAKGGGNGTALDRLKPYLLEQDTSGLQFTMTNALKDLTYYSQMARDIGAVSGIADAVTRTLDGGVRHGKRDAMVPELVDILAEVAAREE